MAIEEVDAQPNDSDDGGCDDDADHPTIAQAPGDRTLPAVEPDDPSVELTGDWLERLRPPDETGAIAMQIIDVQVVDRLPMTFSCGEEVKGDEFLLSVLETGDDRSRAERCTVLLFGCTSSGNSVLAKVSGFRPYLYFEARAADDVFRTRVARAACVDATQLRFETVRRKNMYGWVPNAMAHPTQRREFEYIKVSFPTVESMKRASRPPRFSSSEPLKVHEDKVTADTKFMDDANLVPSGWVIVKNRSIAQHRISHCRLEIECSQDEVTPDDRPDIAPLMVAFVDIECVSDKLCFPDATLEKDEVCQIGVNYWRVGTPKETAVKVLYVSPSRCGPVAGGHVERFDSEFDLLRGFRSSFIDVDPDVVATYNGFGFDLPYLWKRANLLNVDDFFYFDRVIGRRCPAGTKELSSSALGNNELFVVDMHGRTNLDVFHWIKAREKLDSYTLDAVGEHFLGEKKVEMDYKDLFKMARGTPGQIARVGVYCLQDCYLLVLLCIRLQIFAANVEMSRVCHTPMEMLVTRGQQIKVINQLVHYGHRMEVRGARMREGGYILNTPVKFSGGPDDSYMGATVIDAKAKYYREPIATLDFMSLYPSIILANNFCFSTLVLDPRYLNIPGVEYVTIQVEHKTYVWAKGMDGIIPEMMRALLKARKDAKRLMNAAAKRVEEVEAELEQALASGDEEGAAAARAKKEKATVEKAVYNARQLALKISANSIYGFTGAVKTGKYHCLAVADCVTFRAREMLHRTVEMVHEYTNDQCDIVYGDTDSVMVRFFGTEDAEASAAIAEKCADWCTAKFHEETGTEDIVLEFEKVYWPFLLMRKKRYAGLMWEPSNKDNKMVNTKLDAKGIELVRRDNCKLAKRIQKKCLDALMYKRDPDLAIREIKEELALMMSDSVPLLDYKLSKARRKNYVNEDLPHLAVCEKMAKRNPGSEPQVGDRVPYVLLHLRNNAKAKTFEKAEDIGYAARNPLECTIDRLYYLEHQIERPICALMEHVVESSAEIFKEAKGVLSNQLNRQRTLMSMGFYAKPSEGSCLLLTSPRAGAAAAGAVDREPPKRPVPTSNALADAMFGLSAATKPHPSKKARRSTTTKR